jgi:diguanylate cyclase (GGDEF)-like protein
MLDLDGFKQVNDSYGHPVGDALLVEVARRLVDVAPPQTTLARLGGDEFVMLIENADRGGSARTAERVVAALRRPYDLDRQHLRLTASVGVLIINRDPLDSSTAFLRDADAALYDAKKAGRDRAVLRDPSD